MTDKNSEIDLESFVSDLDDTRKESSLKTDGDELSFAGNAIDLSRQDHPLTPKNRELVEAHDLKSSSILRDAIENFFMRFLSFVRVNATITLTFFSLFFLLIIRPETAIPNISAAIKNPWSDGVLLAGIILTFWIFISWIRCSYLVIASNHYDDEEEHRPLIFGIRKLFSFLMLEIMQIVTIILGTLLLFLAPFFSARYFLAMPLLVEDAETDSVESMLKSAKYAEFWMLLVMRCMVFISLFTIFTIAATYILLEIISDNKVIIYSSLLFIFSFFLLPIHCCFRVSLKKKIQFLVKNETITSVFPSDKLMFILSRFLFLALVPTIIWIGLYTGVNSESSLIDSFMDLISKLPSDLQEILGHENHYTAESNN